MNQSEHFSEVAYQWLNKNQTRLAPSTYDKYERIIRNYIEPYFGNLDCSSIKDCTLESFRESLHNREVNQNGNLSIASMRTIFMLVNQSLSYGYQQGYFSGTLHLSPNLSSKRPLAAVFSTEQQKCLEQAIFQENTRFSRAVLLALYSGIRIGELCALKWEDIDFENGSLKIDKAVQRIKNRRNSGTRTELSVLPPKSKCAYRVIPLPTFVFDFLKNSMPENTAGYMFSGEPAKPLDPRTLQSSYRQLLKRHQIPYLNFHCLRHTFATRCVTSGWDVKTLSEVLGHSDIKITMDFYFHSSFEYKKQQMNRLKLL